MYEERGSALIVLMVAVVGVGVGVGVGVAVVFHCQVAETATYTVGGGGGGGWTFNVAGWPRGKNFKAGDTLVFNYNSGVHNVVSVNRGGYRGCATPRGAKMYRSGKDQIKLVKGQNFFICNFSGHCESGMKIAVPAM